MIGWPQGNKCRDASALRDWDDLGGLQAPEGTSVAQGGRKMHSGTRRLAVGSLFFFV